MEAESTLHRSTRLYIAGDSIVINGLTVFVSYLYTVVSDILEISAVKDSCVGYLTANIFGRISLLRLEIFN